MENGCSRVHKLVARQRRDGRGQWDGLYLLLGQDRYMVALKISYINLVGHWVYRESVRPCERIGYRSGCVGGPVNDGLPALAAGEALVGHVDLVGHRVHGHSRRALSGRNGGGCVVAPINHRDIVAAGIDYIDLVGHWVHGHVKRLVTHAYGRWCIAGPVNHRHIVVVLIGYIDFVGHQVYSYPPRCPSHYHNTNGSI